MNHKVAKGYVTIAITLLMGMVLTILPLPGRAVWLRPYWVLANHYFLGAEFTRLGWHWCGLADRIGNGFINGDNTWDSKLFYLA